MSIHTKWRFANALMDLMKTMPFQKITVKNICDYCGEKRQTFYYHFRDKYDLVTWIYYQDASHIIENNTEDPWNVVLEKIFVNMVKRKNFYRSAFEEHGQNALIDYIVEHDILIYKRKLKENLKVDVLDKDLLFSIEYHAYACAHITKNWLCGGAEKTQAKELANLLYSNMSVRLKEATAIRKMQNEKEKG